MVSRDTRADIETLRGIAAVLMVMGHVIGSTADTGMTVAADSGWRHFYATFAPMRMPLFTVISGYVYALRPLASGRVAAYLRGRLRRLLLPLLFVYPLFVWIQHITPGAHQHVVLGLAEYVTFPQAHFWFIYAMIWISVAVIPLELAGWLSTPKRLFGCLLLFSGLWLASLESSKLALANAEHLMPFFLFGIGLERFWDPQQKSDGTKLALTLSMLGLMLCYQLDRLGIWPLTEPSHRALSVALGTSSVAVAFAFRFSWPPLARLGAYSYGIYLLHVFGTAGGRIAMSRLGLDRSVLVFVIGTMAGLVFPMMVEIVTDRSPIVRLLVFGRTKSLNSDFRRGPTAILG